MITKRVENGLISIYPDGQIQVREDTIIEEDGVEISRIFNMAVYNPLTNIETIANPIVKAITKLIWTPEVIAAYERKVANLG